MIRNQKKENTKLERSPFMYYVTNWGFVEQPVQSQPKEKQKR